MSAASTLPPDIPSLSFEQALEQLERGIPVQTISFDLGYESPSAFIAMFRKVLGASPNRYLGRREAPLHPDR